MAVLNAMNNGNAPSNAQIGDTIRTAGGNFNVVAPNTPGAKYNPSSGFWSVKDTTPEYLTNAKSITSNNNSAMTNSAQYANSISSASSAKQYEYNAKEAQKTRDWQEMMSNTAHQREVKDLIAAGLNPVLSATLGGSSTPAGATASGSSYQGQKADVDTSLLPFYSNILGTVLGNQTQKDIAKIQAETALQTAGISSAAAMYSANASAAASRYGADKGFEASNWQNRLFSWVMDNLPVANSGKSQTPSGTLPPPSSLFSGLGSAMFGKNTILGKFHYGNGGRPWHK